MSSRRGLTLLAGAAAALALAVLLAVTLTSSGPTTGERPDDAAAAASDRAAAEAATGDRELVVYRSPGCVCCERWAEHMDEHGFSVRIEEPENLPAIKREHGVSRSLASCHTAVVDGYVIEGHVPADVVLRLLEERPDVRGLAVPGMPVGSPGMEGPNPVPYDVFTFDGDGGISTYARR